MSTPKADSDQDNGQQAEQRRDELLLKLLRTPPQPRQKREANPNKGKASPEAKR